MHESIKYLFESLESKDLPFLEIQVIFLDISTSNIDFNTRKKERKKEGREK